MEEDKKLRPRRKRVGEREQRPYNGGGERRSSFNRGEGPHRSDSSRRSDGPRRDREDGRGGERRNYGAGRSDRPRRDDRPYQSDKPRRDDRPYQSDKPRRNEGPRRDREDGARGGERRNYGAGRSDRSRRDDSPYQSDRSRRNEGPRKTFRPRMEESEESGIARMVNERKKKFGSPELSDRDDVKVPVKDVVRLNKFIANSGVCSRREADTLIQAGVVTVNGEVVTELGTKVNIYKDEIRFNGERLKGEAKVYVLMNKPRGYVTTVTDPHADKTVMELLRGCQARVFPVGRLDKNTTGVLMFTNDGEMAEKLTHPSFDKKKIYQANLDRDLKQEDFDRILAGVELSDGMIAADDLQYIDATDRRKIGIEIHSGKNRIVRRIFESLGYEVKLLDRVYFAGLTKKGLKRGEWRFLTEGEVNILRMGAFK